MHILDVRGGVSFNLRSAGGTGRNHLTLRRGVDSNPYETFLTRLGCRYSEPDHQPIRRGLLGRLLPRSHKTQGRHTSHYTRNPSLGVMRRGYNAIFVGGV
jgi:hypothetical protein